MAGRPSDAADRLRAAAIELYTRDGFAETTVDTIAERAGVTRRTYFRLFADKREVLFGGSEELGDLLASVVAAAPIDTGARDAVVAGLRAVASDLAPRRDELTVREVIVAGSPELREREQAKLGSWSAKLQGALRDRGLPPVEAAVIAGSGIAVLNAAAQRWLAEPDVTLADALDEALGALAVLAPPLEESTADAATGRRA
jgi:AcrR family transcriptional regulator